MAAVLSFQWSRLREVWRHISTRLWVWSCVLWSVWYERRRW
jgi:hypothetical protein